LQEKEIVLANAHLVGHDKRQEVSELETTIAELAAEKKQLGEKLFQTSENLAALTKKVISPRLKMPAVLASFCFHFSSLV